MTVHYTIDGADLVLVYLDENDDARETQRRVERRGRRCMLMPGDIGVDWPATSRPT